MSKFVHLHVHSEFSILDGMAHVEDIIKKAHDDGQPAIAITDHDRLSGVPEFYLACRKYDIKPIIGEEFRICLDHADRAKLVDSETGKKEGPRAYHLVLLARNRRGYEVLCELSSQANSPEYFYYKPRLDYDLISSLKRRDRESIIASTTCANGHVPQLIHEGKLKEAKEMLLYMRELFPHFYVEVQRHPYHRRDAQFNEEQDRINEKLIRLARRYNIPVIITNDSHYTLPEQHSTHDLWCAIQTRSDYRSSERFRFSGFGYHIATTSEMKARWDAETWKSSQRAIRELVAGIEIVLPEFEKRVWHIPVAPRENTEKPSSVYMRQLCEAKLRRLAAGNRLAKDIQAYRDRLEYELKVIFDAKFEEEFFIVRDYIRWARSAGIRVGPGRGSMAGVLAAYLMGIVDVDPVRYGLMFERALNPARPSLPDFDVDFAKSRREEVVAYLLHRYNIPPYQAKQVGTFGRFGPRGTIQNVLRSLGYSHPEAVGASKSLPDSAAITNLKASGELVEILQDRENLHPILINAMDTWPKFYEWSTTIQDMISGLGKHAAGIVISDDSFNLKKLVPTMTVGRGAGRGEQAVVTQFDMGGLKTLGVVKFDILSLDTLDIIQEVCDAIGHDPFKDMTEYEDPKVWDTINSGAAYGIFQVEGAASKQVVRDLQLKSFEDLIAVMALGRSGANQFVPQYKEGRDNPGYIVSLPDKRLRKIMPRGVILYQEQVMEVGLQIAGMDHHVVDELKEAIKYKKGDVWDALKPIFFNGGKYKGGHCVGALQNGCSKKVADAIWDMIFAYRGYGFNRAHAVSYAMISYQTAWLKTYYPAQFYAALLTHKEHSERAGIIEEAKRYFGIKFLPPDVNESGVDFTVVGKRRIRYGLSAVKGVGVVACNEILEKRPFISLDDMLLRVTKRKCNSRVVDLLTQVWSLESIGQPGNPNRDSTELELLGTYVSAHPMDRYRKNVDKRINGDLKWFDRPYDKLLWVGGIIKEVRPIVARNGKPMAFIKVAYEGVGEWEVVAFNEQWEKYRNSLTKGKIVCIYGKYQHERKSVLLEALELPKPEKVSVAA
jgi:DNA polymerase III subunit alpha